MCEQELLHVMLSTYYADDSPTVAADAMHVVLDVLHANGYRRCAEGQRATQWCERANKAEAEVERLRAERDDDRRREYGYSQQTVDALTKERDALRAEAERLREGRATLISEIEMLRERLGNTLDPNDYGKGIWARIE